MKMGEEVEESLKAFFAVRCVAMYSRIPECSFNAQELSGKVSLSLDAWTSPNGIAFMAIIAHYVTNKGKLEETLIDFRELLGEHSGVNMADAVWETIKKFGLEGRVSVVGPVSCHLDSPEFKDHGVRDG